MAKQKPLDGPLNKRYHRCTLKELTTFTANRGLQVVGATRNSRPARRDYVRVLKKADSQATFRFLDLPPELRNVVYCELLTLQNSFTCHPQILRTSKQIKDEAQSLLYNQNLIEIKRSVARTARIQQQVSAMAGHAAQGPTSASRLYAFVAREHVDSMQQIRKAKIGNMIYSLCNYLAEHHELRSLSIELNEVPAGPDAQHAILFSDWIKTALYPLRRLAPIPGLVIEGVDTAEIASFVAELRQHQSESKTFKKWPYQKGLIGYLVNYTAAVKELQIWMRPEWATMKLRLVNAVCRGLLQGKLRSDVVRDLEAEFLRGVDRIRAAFESADRYDNPGLFADVSNVLREGVEVELRRTQRKNKGAQQS